MTAAANGQTNADGSQNIISQARLVDEVRRLVLQSVKNERFLKQPTTAGLNTGIAGEEATSATDRRGGRGAAAQPRRALPLEPRDAFDRGDRHPGRARTPTRSLGPVPAEQPQVANDGSAFVDPTNTFTDTATGQTFGYSSGLSGILPGPARP